MANGDEAAAAGMDIVASGGKVKDGYDEINKTRDYIAQRTNSVQPVAKGGTGATTASAARTNLGAVAAADVYDGGSVANKIAKYDGSGRLICATPAASNQAAPKVYVDEAVNDTVKKTGNQTMSGHLFLPNSSTATSSYTVGYINGDGRVSRGASSEKYKKFVSEIDPLVLGDLFPAFKRFQLRGGDGVWRYGYTAEQIAAGADTEQFAVYARHVEDDGTAPHLERDDEGNPIPESIDFIGLLLAQVAQLNVRLAAIEARHADS